MKINPLGQRNATKVAQEHKMVSADSFAGEMNKVSHQQINRDLQEIMKQIETVGERLENSLSLAELRDYKRLVGDFLRLVSRRGFKTEQEMSWGFDGQQRMYNVVRVINRHMAELGQLLLTQEQDRLEVVATIDQIRGLILDLYT